MELDDALSILRNMQLVSLATVEGDQPRVRTVTLIPYRKELWMASRTSADKVGQIQRNDRVEISLNIGEGEDIATLRGTGRVEIVTDQEVKREVADHMPFFNLFWRSVDEPEFTLMRLVLDRIKVLFPYRNEVASFDLRSGD
jgi:uncharacterized pyridoxamine 5'-phosphate oxidase family protein